MIEPRKSPQASRGGQADKAARKEIAEAREEIAEAREEIAETREAIAETQEGLDHVRGLAFAVAAAEQEAASEGKLDPVSEIIENEIRALGDRLSPRQRVVLADLIRLHFSRRGPQHLLETAGNFSRPVYPPNLHRRSR
jgi:hypothetical protein